MNPTTVADILRLITQEPGRPRVTWYGADGERVELSGAVLENWVNKTVNLLVEEFDAGPGTRVLIDLPPHWRTLVWALAVWRAGACVITEADDVDVVITSDPTPREGAAQVVVALPALARAAEGALPPGAIDANRAVMTYGDQIIWSQPVDLDAAALSGVPHAGLRRWASHPDGRPEGARVLWTASRNDEGVVDLLRCGVDSLAGGGSIVVLAPPRDEVTDTELRERLALTERVDARWHA